MTAPLNTRGAVSAASRVAVAASAVLAADLAFDPVDRHVPLCPLHAVTGLNCPLCGSLRAIFELAHGHLLNAVHDNLLLIAALPMIAVWWITSLLRGAPGRRPRWLVPAVLGVAVTFAVVRNLPLGRALSPS